MLLSSICSLFLYLLACIIYISTPAHVFTDASSTILWVFIILALVGAIAGNIRAIALSTLVTILIPEEERDKANGLVGSANGVAFLVASLLSGLAIGFLTTLWISREGLQSAHALPDNEHCAYNVRSDLKASSTVLMDLSITHKLGSFFNKIPSVGHIL